MKRTRFPLFAGLMIFSASSRILTAADFTWNGNGANDDWSTPLNWGGSLPDNNGTATTIFAGNNRLTPNIDAAWSVLGLSFAPGASAFTIGGIALTIGSGGITNSSSSIQTLTSPLVVGANQIWSATSGKLVIGSTSISTDTITLGANQLTFTGNQDIDLHGEISGTDGSVVKSGIGVLTITTNQTFTGGFTINGGVVNIGGGPGRLGPGASSVTLNGGAIRLDGTSNLEKIFTLGASGGTFESLGASPFISGKISGPGQLIKTGAANLQLFNNTNDYSGGTLVSGGKLITYGQALKSSVSNNATVEFGGTNAGSYDGSMTGSGSLLKTGASIFTLTGASINLGGSLDLQAGDLTGAGYSLVFGGNMNLGADTEIAFTGSGNTLSAAAIDLNATAHLSLGATLVGTNASAGAVTGSGTIDLGTNNLTIGVGDVSSTLGSVVSGSGSLIKIGSGTLTISPNQDFTGGFLINGGIVDIGGGFLRLGPSNGTVTLNGGTLRTDGTTNLAQTFSIGALGGAFDSLSGTPFISNQVIATGLLTKKGAGNLQLSNINNNLGGGLLIEAGKLILSGYSGSGPVTNDGVLEFSGASSIDYRTISGSGGIIKSGAGNLHHSQAVIDIGGSYLLNGGTITVAGSSITADGGISLADGTSLTTDEGAGDPTSDLNGGQLHLGVGSFLTLGGAIGGNAWDTEAVFADLTGTGTVALSTAGNARFTLNNPLAVTANVSFSGGNAAEQDGFIKTGAGDLTLTANNSALNYLEIQQGTLNFSDSLQMPMQLHLKDSSEMKSLNHVTLNSAIELSGNPIVDTSDKTLTLSGTVTGSGNLRKQGSGTLTLTQSNTFTGALEIEEGTVSMTHVYALGTTDAGTIVQAGASLVMNGAYYLLDDLTLAGTGVNGDGGLRIVSQLYGPVDVYGDTLTLAADSLITVTGGTSSIALFRIQSGTLDFSGYDLDIIRYDHPADVQISAQMVGSGSLDFSSTSGSALWLFGNSPSYSGNIVSGGDLQVRHDQALGNGNGSTRIGGGYSLVLKDNLTVMNEPLVLENHATIKTSGTSGAGPSTWGGSADIELLGSAQFGEVDVWSSNLTISGSGKILGDAELSVISGINDEIVIAREIDMGANSSVVKSEDGLLRLNGVMKTAVFRIEQGTVILGENALLPPSGKLQVLAGSTLQLNNSDQVVGSMAGTGDVVLGTARLTTGGDDSTTTFGGLISGPGGLAKTGSGTFTISTAQTYTGDTEVLAGTLVIQEPSLDDEADVVIGPDGMLHLDFDATDTIGGLVINGIRQPSGFWGAPGNPAAELTSPLITGDGLLWIGTRIDYTWNGLDADDFWASASNWIGGQAPPANGRSGVIFDGDNRLAPENQSPWHIAGLVFAENASAFTLGGETLTIGFDGIENLGPELQTITNPLVASGPQTWSATNGPLALGVPGVSIESDDIVTLDTPHYIHLIADWTGQGSLEKTGNGELLISGTLDAASLTMSAGAVRLGASNRISSSTQVVIEENVEWNLNGHSETLGSLESYGMISLGAGTLQIDGSGFVGGSIAGTGELIANPGNGVVTIAGPASHTGGTRILSGALEIIDGGSIGGTITGDADSEFHFITNSPSTFAGVFTSEPWATFRKSGGATLTLEGTTTHSGTTVIGGGTLKLGSSDRISDTSDLVVHGTLDLDGFDERLVTIEGTGEILLGGGDLNFSSVGSYFYGAIRDAGKTGSFIKGGDGFWILEKEFNDPNSGVLEAGLFEVAEGSFTANNADISVNTMRVLEDSVAFVNDGTWQASAVELDGALTFENTGETPAVRYLGSLSGGGTLTVHGPYNALATSLAGNGSIFLEGSEPFLEGATSFQIDHDNDQALGWTITGDVEVDEFEEIVDGYTIFAKSGSGVLTIDQPLDQLAEIAVFEGTLAFSDVADLGARYLVLQNTGTLRVTAADQVLSLPIYGSGSPAIDTGIHTLQTTDFIFLGDDELRKTGGGELFAASGHIVSGSLRVEEGSMSLGAAEMLANLVYVHLADGTTLKLEGNDQTIGTIEGDGVVHLGGADLRLTAQEDDEEHLFSGTISGVGSVSKFNAAGLTFAQAPAWQGDTAVIAGQITLQQPGLHDDSDVILDLDGTLVLDFIGIDTVDGLVIDGDRQASGTWGAAGSGAQHETDQLSGTGLLYVRSAFDSWIAQYYPEGPDRGFNADPDRDGIPNGIEFVIGSLPRGDLESAAASLAKLPTFSRLGNTIEFAFRRTHRSAYLNPFVEHGDDLKTWLVAFDGPVGVPYQESFIDLETDLITVQIALPLTPPGNIPPARYFARLGVVGSGP